VISAPSANDGLAALDELELDELVVEVELDDVELELDEVRLELEVDDVGVDDDIELVFEVEVVVEVEVEVAVVFEVVVVVAVEVVAEVAPVELPFDPEPAIDVAPVLVPAADTLAKLELDAPVTPEDSGELKLELPAVQSGVPVELPQLLTAAVAAMVAIPRMACRRPCLMTRNASRARRIDHGIGARIAFARTRSNGGASVCPGRTKECARVGGHRCGPGCGSRSAAPRAARCARQGPYAALMASYS
jgi:hypothetical protein